MRRWSTFFWALRQGRARWNLGHGLLAVVSALLIPCLVLDLGLIVQLIVVPGSAEGPRDLILGSVVSGRLGPWPWLGREDLCLLMLVGLGLMLGAAQSLTGAWLILAAVRQANRVASAWREQIYEQAVRLGASEVIGAGRTRPEVLLADRVDKLQEGARRWFLAVPRAAVAMVALLLLALLVNFWLTLLAGLLALLIWRVQAGLQLRLARRADASRQESDGRLRGLLDDLRMVPLTSTYGVEAASIGEFRERLATQERAASRAEWLRRCGAPALQLMVLVAAAFLLLVVGFSPYVSVSGSVTLCTALLCAYFPASRLADLPAQLAEPERAAQELKAYLAREPKVNQVAAAQPLERLEREITLEHVTLADAAGCKVLDDVSLSLPAGKRLAIVASDPHTAAALSGLLVRMYDPAAGRICFDGRDIREATLETLRGQLLLVPADGPLRRGSVTENIRCGGADFTQLQVADAAKQARAYSFIQHLPQGFATDLGNGAVELRSSERFRIGLARAALRDPSVLVIQEPTLHGESEVEPLVEEALRLLAAQRTLIMLPGRLASLRHADRVYLFHEGRLQASGEHAQLLQASDLYRHLVYIRFNPYASLT